MKNKIDEILQKKMEKKLSPSFDQNFWNKLEREKKKESLFLGLDFDGFKKFFIPCAILGCFSILMIMTSYIKTPVDYDLDYFALEVSEASIKDIEEEITFMEEADKDWDYILANK